MDQDTFEFLKVFFTKTRETSSRSSFVRRGIVVSVIRFWLMQFHLLLQIKNKHAFITWCEMLSWGACWQGQRSHGQLPECLLGWRWCLCSRRWWRPVGRWTFFWWAQTWSESRLLRRWWCLLYLKRHKLMKRCGTISWVKHADYHRFSLSTASPAAWVSALIFWFWFIHPFFHGETLNSVSSPGLVFGLRGTSWTILYVQLIAAFCRWLWGLLAQRPLLLNYLINDATSWGHYEALWLLVI